MNSANKQTSLVKTTRPINYDISKSLERKVSLYLAIGSLVVVKIYCCVTIVFLNIRSEKKSVGIIHAAERLFKQILWNIWSFELTAFAAYQSW